MAKKTTFDNRSPDARSRELKCCFHKGRAKLWLFPLVMVNTLFYFFLVCIPGFVLIRFRIGTDSLVLIILFGWMINKHWWLIKKIRRIRVNHLILAEGYAKPFAEDIVTQVRSEGRKFALFLRGFDLESRSITYSGINIEFDLRELKLHARPVEGLLVEMLNKNLPLIALTNPSDPRPIGGAYRFKSIPNDWRQFVGELLPDAFPILMHLSSFSLGILDELELLKLPRYSK